ncbi:capsular polysaccharide export protein [Novosphingobium chloroacetimidivorans]|uniref:Capsular polysaccharide export protein n=1 Tax=Novosphingobium chloroacetimidivorans TaxID=1428314 RepID=A0A7W7KD01_9SPHN|nr:beta-3-deoxy-D-manno-oct-2-ulosonic acid transferase [Novosphingobium chloroacetimidivorans]MBB4860564.1 capsular polysaccharide export protein [Novosphingobium chloroacetimidivorans]
MTGTPVALLRAPPFPSVDARVSVPLDTPPEPQPMAPADLFALLREARVGGRFWADHAKLATPAGIVVKPRGDGEIASELAGMTPQQRQSALWIASDRRMARKLAQFVRAENGAWRGDVDPWSALEGAQILVAHGDDEWVAIARILGIEVRVLSPGRFGTPDSDAAELDRRVAAALMAAHWRDPFTGAPSSIEATIELLAMWRTMLDANRAIAAVCGMAWWKRAEIRRFLWHPQRRLRLFRSAGRALATADRRHGALAIWPSRVSGALIAQSRDKRVPLMRVEDGFVRSVGLGVHLVPPSSVVVDAAGIHFDPRSPSDCEQILATTQFSHRLLERARALRETIVTAGISKYAAGATEPVPQRQPGRRLVLVAAQVEDDMSVLAGGGGLTSNLEVLRRARALEPNAEIWFRPHPDVDAGHRKGSVPDAEVLTLADRIVRGPSMAALLEAVDAVHVLTSLTGFEALLRGCAVTCHGTPFYAGWGLTRDLGQIPDRRGRALSLDALVAGVLILYPRYLDPVTTLPCPPEVLVARMATAQAPNRLGWIEPLRRWQGRLTAALR